MWFLTSNRNDIFTWKNADLSQYDVCCCGFSSEERHISDVIDSLVAKTLEISDVFVDLFATTTNAWKSMKISRPWQKNVDIFEDFAPTPSSGQSFFIFFQFLLHFVILLNFLNLFIFFVFHLFSFLFFFFPLFGR